MKILRVLGLAVLSVVAVSGSTAPVWAQPGGPGGPGGGGRGGGMGRSPKMRLPRLISSANRLSGSNALTKVQARRMVSLVTPWRKRPTMSDADAKTLYTNLSGTLTATQKTALQNDRPGGGRDGGRGDGPGRGGREGGPGGGGGGRMGGGPGGPGGGQMPSREQMDKMRAQMEKVMASYNPLYSGTPAGVGAAPPQMKEMMKRRSDRLNSTLSELQQKAR